MRLPSAVTRSVELVTTPVASPSLSHQVSAPGGIMARLPPSLASSPPLFVPIFLFGTSRVLLKSSGLNGSLATASGRNIKPISNLSYNPGNRL
jgi:hypothetical protein